MLLAQVEKKLLWGRWELGNLAASKWNTGWPLTVSTLRHLGTGTPALDPIWWLHHWEQQSWTPPPGDELS